MLWSSPWHNESHKEDSKNAFRERLKAESLPNWKLFVKLRDMLSGTFNIEVCEAWTEASAFFPPGGREYNTDEGKQLKAQLTSKYARRLEVECGTEGAFMVAAEGALSSAAREALSQRPPGKGSITVEEVRWVMDHSEYDFIDAREVPNQGILGQWRSCKKNRSKWEQVWAGKLLDATDFDAKSQRQVTDQQAEAEAHAKACQEMQSLLSKYKSSARNRQRDTFNGKHGNVDGDRLAVCGSGGADI